MLYDDDQVMFGVTLMLYQYFVTLLPDSLLLTRTELLMQSVGTDSQSEIRNS